MTILLRKLHGEAVALIRQDGGILRYTQGRCASLLQTAWFFFLIIAPPLAMLALTALAVHLGADGSGLLLAVSPLIQLRADRDKLIEDANAATSALQAKCKAENRAPTKEEEAEEAKWDAKVEAAVAAVKFEEKKQSRERELGSGGEDPSRRRVPGAGRQRDGSQVTSQHDRTEDDPRRGFHSHQDYCLAVMKNAGARNRDQIRDDRLKPLVASTDADDDPGIMEDGLAFMLPLGFSPTAPRAAVGSDEAGTYSDQYGGALVPTSRAPGFLQLEAEPDPTDGLTTPLPMATPSVEIAAATDKDHSTSVTGGLVFTRRAETTTTEGKRRKVELITFKAQSLWGIGFATEEILRDSPISFAALISNGFRTQRSAHMLNEKLNGAAGDEYQGVMNSPAKIAVPKESGQSALTINGTNIVKMAARCWMFGRAIWLANHNTRPQLAQAHLPLGTGDAIRIYQPAQQPGFPDMLWGRPVFYTEFCKTLGTEGDLVLAVWSQFIEGIYQPLESAESVHVRFLYGERTFRFWERNCGAPWWRSVLTPRNGDTLSPIITLATRA